MTRKNSLVVTANSNDNENGAQESTINNENNAALALLSKTTESAINAPLTDSQNISTSIQAVPVASIDPIIDSNGQQLKEGVITSDSAPIISGTGEPGNQIEVTILPPMSIWYHHYTVTVDVNGNWTLQPPLFNGGFGNYELHVSAEDANGKNGHYLANFELTYFDPSLITMSLDAVTDQVNNGFNDFHGVLSNDATTNDARPLIEGSCSKGNVNINIYDNGHLIGSVYTNYAQAWSFQPTEDLSEGVHHITAAFEWQGTEYQQTELFTFSIDTTPPSGELISVVDHNGDIISPNSASSETSPTLTGKADPDSSVHIHVYGPGEQPLYWADAQIDEQGNWHWTAPAVTQTGDYTYQIAVTDPVGNVSYVTPAYTYTLYDASQLYLTVDTVVDSVNQSPNDFIGNLTDGDITNDNRPVLTGTTNAGFTINLYDNGTFIGSSVANAQGVWQFKPYTALADGVHHLTATEVIPTGESQPTDPFTITVMATPPEGDLLAITDHEGVVIESGTKTGDADPLLSGTAPAGSEIHIHAFASNGRQMYTGTAIADEHGRWVYQPEPFSSYGKYSFNIAIIDSIGNVTRPDTNYVVEYGDVSPFHYSLGGVDDTYSDEGVGPKGPLDDGGITDDLRPLIYGYSNAGMKINVYDNGQLLGTTRTSDNGFWSLKSYPALAEGEHSITVSAVPTQGETPPTEPFHFIVDRSLAQGTIDSVTTLDGSLIQPEGNTLVSQTVITGHVDPGTDVHLHVYKDGQQLYWVDVPTDAQGNWQYQPAEFTEFGRYSFSLALIGFNGMVSRPDVHYEISYYDPAFSTLTFDSVSDNVALDVPQYDYTGILADGATTNDSAPTLQGTTNAGYQVNIYDNGNLIGSTVASEEGQWTFKPDTALGDGPHSVTVTEVTPMGEIPSPTVMHFSVDTAPAQAEIEQLTDTHGQIIVPGSTTEETQPVISGYANPDSEVHVHVLLNGHELYWEGVAAGDDGHWQFQPETLSEEGLYTFTVAVVTPGGNVYRSAEGWSIDVKPTSDNHELPLGNALLATVEHILPDELNVTSSSHGLTESVAPLNHDASLTALHLPLSVDEGHSQM